MKMCKESRKQITLTTSRECSLSLSLSLSHTHTHTHDAVLLFARLLAPLSADRRRVDRRRLVGTRTATMKTNQREMKALRRHGVSHESRQTWRFLLVVTLRDERSPELHLISAPIQFAALRATKWSRSYAPHARETAEPSRATPSKIDWASRCGLRPRWRMIATTRVITTYSIRWRIWTYGTRSVPSRASIFIVAATPRRRRGRVNERRRMPNINYYFVPCASRAALLLLFLLLSVFYDYEAISQSNGCFAQIGIKNGRRLLRPRGDPDDNIHDRKATHSMFVMTKSRRQRAACVRLVT